MANNVQAETVSVAGVRFAAAEVTLYGDANTFVPGCYLGIVSGAEGAQTFTEYVGGAGAVTAGTQRMTLASDDPAVALLTTMDADTGGILTAVQLLDDSVGTFGAAAPSKGLAVGFLDGAGGNIVHPFAVASAMIGDDKMYASLHHLHTLSIMQMYDGSGFDLVRGDSTNGLLVNLGANNDVSLAAGTNNIGDVDILSVVPGSGATNLGKAEDAPHSSGDIGVFMLGVRRDSPVSGADTDGDYAHLSLDSSGRLYANVGNTVTVTGTVTAAQATAANLNATVVGTGTFAVQAAQSGAWNITNVSGTVSLPTGAATAAKQPALGTAGTASTDVITVQGIASMTPLLVTAQASTNTQEVVGDAAHGAAVAGNPLLVGLEGRSSDGTAVDSGDVVRALASLLGKQVTLPYAIPASTWSYATATAGVTDTADDEAKAAGAAGVRHYITSVQVINGHATVATEVVIKDGSTVLWRGWAEAVGGGVSAKFDPPLRGTAATAVNVANITTGSKTYFNLQGYSALE